MANISDIHFLDTHPDGLNAPAETLLLLHGFFMDGRMFRHQVEAFKTRFRVIVPDLRGFGGTPSAGLMSLEEQADELVELMSSLGIERFHVGGMSMGGYLALRLARRYEKRLISLILIATQSGRDNPETVKNFTALRNNWSNPVVRKMIVEGLLPVIIGEDKTETAFWRPIWLAHDPKAIGFAMDAMNARDELDPSFLKLPTAIVHGKADRGIPPSAAEANHAAIVGSKLLLVDGARHAVNLTHADLVNAFLANFFDGLAA